jgi:hypothetical protein
VKPGEDFFFRLGLGVADDVVEVGIASGVREMSMGGKDAATGATRRG